MDEANLQPQYRTFSEIRDNMLQQARQRADVFVRDVCHPTKNGTVTLRVSTNTNSPTATDVSQMNSNVSKPETDEQESDFFNTSKIRSAMGKKCSLSRVRAKMVLWGLVSSVE